MNTAPSGRGPARPQALFQGWVSVQGVGVVPARVGPLAGQLIPAASRALLRSHGSGKVQTGLEHRGQAPTHAPPVFRLQGGQQSDLPEPGFYRVQRLASRSEGHSCQQACGCVVMSDVTTLSSDAELAWGQKSGSIPITSHLLFTLLTAISEPCLPPAGKGSWSGLCPGGSLHLLSLASSGVPSPFLHLPAPSRRPCSALLPSVPVPDCHLFRDPGSALVSGGQVTVYSSCVPELPTHTPSCTLALAFLSHVRVSPVSPIKPMPGVLLGKQKPTFGVPSAPPTPLLLASFPPWQLLQCQRLGCFRSRGSLACHSPAALTHALCNLGRVFSLGSVHVLPSA